MTPTFTAVIGGIGAGKSVVSSILRAMGYPVYDCDSRAKTIVDTNTYIHQQLCEHIHPEAVVECCVNRPLISKIVFSDSNALCRLNKIVHQAVLEDLLEWKKQNIEKYNHLFVETAIPISSGLINIVDDSWLVDAPIYIRVGRVQKRNNLSEQQILARINAQSAENPTAENKFHIIVNDNSTPVLPQIINLLSADSQSAEKS